MNECCGFVAHLYAKEDADFSGGGFIAHLRANLVRIRITFRLGLVLHELVKQKIVK